MSSLKEIRNLKYMINKNKKALGKNLSSILKNSDNTLPDMNFNDQSSNKLLIKKIQLNQIKVNNSQPRLFFDKHKLISLANSIKEIGIIQPITVRNIGYKKFQIISGERRFRACKIAKLDTIPAYIITANDKEILEMALVENVQREDLSVIEIANGFQLLIQECGITQEKLSHRLGKKRSTITNYLRLLKLNPIIQAGLNDNIIGIGHAKLLINVMPDSEQIRLYKLLIKNKLSVKELYQLINDTENDKFKENKNKEVINSILKKTGCSSNLNIKKKGDGKLIISFNNIKEFNKIIECFKD
tara:strand:+ start:265 stop:1167 length:903 start_codon:yes stop_codon:yes gene_type:complete